MQLHSRMSWDIAVTRFWDWNALVQYLAWHGCSTDLARYRLHWQVRRCRAGPVPWQLALSKRAGPAWHGSARLSTMLARFGYVYTATANRAEPCWYRAGTVSSGSVNTVLGLLHNGLHLSSLLLHKHKYMWPDLGNWPYENFCANEVLVSPECTFHCALIGTIDTQIDASVEKLQLTPCAALLKHCFGIRHVFLYNDCVAMISIYYVDARSHMTCIHAMHVQSVCVEWFAGCWQRFYWLPERVY